MKHYKQQTLWNGGVQTRLNESTQKTHSPTRATHKQKTILETLVRRLKCNCQTSLLGRVQQPPRRIIRNLSQPIRKLKVQVSTPSMRKNISLLRMYQQSREGTYTRKYIKLARIQKMIDDARRANMPRVGIFCSQMRSCRRYIYVSLFFFSFYI